MAKKDKRSRSRGSGAGAAGADGARNEHAAKQVAAKRRRSQKSTKPSRIHKNMLAIALVSFIVLAIGLVFVTKMMMMMMMSSDNGEGSEDDVADVADGRKLVPPIDGVAMEVNDGRGNKTLDFLNHFVCDYPPSITTTKSADEIDAGEKGYCHPRLSAVPHHRTHRVSIFRDDSTTPTAPTLIYQKFKNWGNEIIRYYFTVTDESSETILDHGIRKGELLMRLPRPLQVWDLDALRDKYIQQHFLGLKDSSEDDEMEEMEEGSSLTVPVTVSARHKHTQNPLDSGAFLAVHLIRLVQGARARAKKKGGDNIGREENKQCQDDTGECKALNVRHWDDYEPHETKRIDTLAPYLDILPTSTHRMKKSTVTEINPQSHPLFWSSRLLQSIFPPNTYTFDLIKQYQAMAESEYEALKLTSEEFGEKVGYLSYLNMRANVLSRAFGVPVVSSSSSDDDNDEGAFWGVAEDDDDAKVVELSDEMRSYETSNFGSFLNDDDDGKAGAVEEFKLRSMCPLLDMYNSHPNPNVSWRYDPQTSSFVVRAMPKRNSIPPGHSIVVSYGKYTDGHMFAKYGYVNGDGSSATEISLAVFHRPLGDVGLGRQYSQLPFQLRDVNYRKDVFDSPENDDDERLEFDARKSLSSAKEALKIQARELVRYLIFDDGYDDCIDVSVDSRSNDEELKLLKLRHLIRLADYRDAWIVRVPPQFPDAEPSQQTSEEGSPSSSSSSSSSSAAQSKKDEKEPEKAVGINANRIVSICRLVSLRPEDVGGDAIDYLREGLISNSESPSNTHFLVEKAEDVLEYRAMMCVVRLCNVGLSRYVGYDNAEPEVAGSRVWNAWYVTKGEVRALGMLLQTAASEANKYKRLALRSKKRSVGGSTTTSSGAAMKVREEGACPLNYTLPLLDRL